VALLGIGVGVLAVPALAQDCPELVGNWPAGDAFAVSVSGPTAYLGSGSTLVVVDVSYPTTPTFLGETPLAGVVNGVAVSGAYAYVAIDQGLIVVDVSNPSAPIVVGSVDTPGAAQGVAVSFPYAYVASWNGLFVADVSNPAAPVEVGRFAGGTENGVAVSGPYVYVAGWGPPIEVLTSCEDLLFSDGFESGDTSAWSATVP
jgi:hypothetical protein